MRAPFALGSHPSVPRSTPACAISCISFPIASISCCVGGSFVSAFFDLYKHSDLMDLSFCGTLPGALSRARTTFNAHYEHSGTGVSGEQVGTARCLRHLTCFNV